MIPAERRQIILGMIAEKSVVSIAELIDRLNVSHMTIRRDLQKLEQQGAVTLVSGGVQLSGRVAHEPSHQMKTALAMKQKQRSESLQPVSFSPAVASIWMQERPLLPSLSIWLKQNLLPWSPMILSSQIFCLITAVAQLFTPGGCLPGKPFMCGEATATMLRGLMIDQAFISASSWSVRGISTPAEDKVTVKRAIADASRQRILVCDATKYGGGDWLALSLDAFDTIITDDGLSENARAELEKQEASLLMVSTHYPPTSLRTA